LANRRFRDPQTCDTRTVEADIPGGGSNWLVLSAIDLYVHMDCRRSADVQCDVRDDCIMP
jgi:hypothetical protein